MKTELIHDLPPGAFATVTLRDGTKFYGEEDSRDQLRDAGVLRMTRRSLNDIGYVVFYCRHADVICWSMECEG